MGLTEITRGSIRRGAIRAKPIWNNVYVFVEEVDPPAHSPPLAPITPDKYQLRTEEEMILDLDCQYFFSSEAAEKDYKKLEFWFEADQPRGNHFSDCGYLLPVSKTPSFLVNKILFPEKANSLVIVKINGEWLEFDLIQDAMAVIESNYPAPYLAYRFEEGELKKFRI